MPKTSAFAILGMLLILKPYEMRSNAQLEHSLTLGHRWDCVSRHGHFKGNVAAADASSALLKGPIWLAVC
jgi:hypothetical protein